MPTLPLPDITNGVPLDTGVLPVSGVADVQAQWAPEMNRPDVAPVRDAVQSGELDTLLAYQRATRYAAAQCDPLRATGEYLDEIGDERSIGRRTSEADGAYRARVNAVPTLVDPNDIIAAANAVLAPYTSISCRYAERSDGLFLANETSAAWSSHLFASTDATSHVVPNYPDRLYPDATAAGLTSIANRRPPGAMLNGDSYGRWLLLRAPDVSLVDSTVAGVFDGTETDPTDGFFLGGGTSGTNTTYLFDFVSTVDGVYEALVGAVEAIRGQSVRWTLYVDPGLSA